MRTACNNDTKENIICSMCSHGNFDAIVQNCYNTKYKSEDKILRHHGEKPEFLDFRIESMQESEKN